MGDPVNFIDFLGLSRLTVGLNDGSVIVIDNPSASDFVTTINNASDGSIDLLQIFGHGDDMAVCISSGISCTDYVDWNKNVYDENGLVQNIEDLLSEKLSAESQIRLEGCSNASGDENIAKSFSESFPNTPVTGGVGRQWGYENHWIFGNSSRSFGRKATYINGVKQ